MNRNFLALPSVLLTIFISTGCNNRQKVVVEPQPVSQQFEKIVCIASNVKDPDEEYVIHSSEIKIVGSEFTTTIGDEDHRFMSQAALLTGVNNRFKSLGIKDFACRIVPQAKASDKG
jgi:hypothetical protein